MNIKIICPHETSENAKHARKILVNIMVECREIGKREAPWLIAETITKIFVTFGAAYCTYLGLLLLSHSSIYAILGTILISLLGICLTLQTPLMSDTRFIIQHARLMDVFRLINSIIQSLDTISFIQAESPEIFSSEFGTEAKIMREANGDIILEIKSHRYEFPMASKYMTIYDNSGMATIDFHAIDRIIEKVMNSPINILRNTT